MTRLIVSFAAVGLVAACAGGPVGTVAVSTSAVASATPSVSEQTPPSASPTTSAATSPQVSLNPPVIARIPVGNGPIVLAASDDAVWVENHRDNNLSRIDPETNQVVAELDEVSVHCAVTYADGSIWTANAFPGVVTEVDPSTNEIIRTLNVPDACGVTVDGGDLWITSPRDGIFRYSVESGDQVDQFAIRGTFGVSPGFDSLWAMTEEGGGKILRIDPESGDILAEILIAGADGQLVAFDAVWASSRSGRSIYRIDPEDNSIADQLDIGGSVGGFSAGQDAIWASTLGGELVAIDSATVDELRRASVGLQGLGPPIEAFDSLWVAALDANVVLRVDPALE